MLTAPHHSRVVTTHEPIAPRAALVLDSPHSGTDYPADFDSVCEFQKLRTAEDTFVGELYDFAPSLGVPLVEAHFPRSYLDANRHYAELDASMLDAAWPAELADSPKIALGKGLIWRCMDDGTLLYNRKLSVSEVQSRIERCWHPYHAAVKASIDAAHSLHGAVLHINCHSMPSTAGAFGTGYAGEKHPDFVVGDRDGSTAHAALSARLVERLKALGYSVAHNHPYKGVELVKRYSAPSAGRHSIQLEINRRLYMDEKRLEKSANYEQLKLSLLSVIKDLCAIDIAAMTKPTAGPALSVIAARHGS
jgi:N-formylglutamate deformylase